LTSDRERVLEILDEVLGPRKGAMTTINYWTHGDPPRAHEWRYLGRVHQKYHCVVCDLRVGKAELKANTDA